jgi:hypothetical protein
MFLFRANNDEYIILVWEHTIIFYVLDMVSAQTRKTFRRRAHILDSHDFPHTLAAKCVAPNHIKGCCRGPDTLRLFDINLDEYSMYGYRNYHNDTSERSKLSQEWNHSTQQNIGPLSIVSVGDDTVAGSPDVYTTSFDTNIITKKPNPQQLIAARLEGVVSKTCLPEGIGPHDVVIPLAFDGSRLLYSKNTQLFVHTEAQTTPLQLPPITSIINVSTCGHGHILLHVQSDHRDAVIIVPQSVNPDLEPQPLCARHPNTALFHWCPQLSEKDPEHYKKACGERFPDCGNSDGIRRPITVATDGENFLLFFRSHNPVPVLSHINNNNLIATCTPFELGKGRQITMTDHIYYHSVAANDFPLGELVRWKESCHSEMKIRSFDGATRVLMWMFILCAKKQRHSLPSQFYNLIAYFATGAIYSPDSPYHAVMPTLATRLGKDWITNRKAAIRTRTQQDKLRSKLIAQINTINQKLKAVTAKLTHTNSAIEDAERVIHSANLEMIAPGPTRDIVFVPTPVTIDICGKPIYGEHRIVVGYTCVFANSIVDEKCICRR